ncbi:hypothetical protein ENBRE01_0662 [Enteropsectra breve]|nr:hypothetical protein ENBRE01_0662 [Enteropsectra breve]
MKQEIEFQELDGIENYYAICNPSDNRLRHFGVMINGRLIVDSEERSIILSKDQPEHCSLRTKAFWELKENDYNLLVHGIESLEGLKKQVIHRQLYIKTKHFNRKVDPALGAFFYKSKKDVVSLEIKKLFICVLGDESYCFLRFKPISKLSFKVNHKLLK